MKLFKYLLPLAVATCGMTASLHAQEGAYSTTTEAQQRDFQSLQEFIKTKRAISIQEKGGNMSLSGDIRGEWYFMKAKSDGHYLRGWKSKKTKTEKDKGDKDKGKVKDAKVAKGGKEKSKKKNYIEPEPTNEFDVEANLILDYTAEKGWGTIRLQMANSAGIPQIERKDKHTSRNIMYGSGTLDKLALRKCFAGYNVWERGTSRFDLEIGRRRLYDVFDSRIQFGSYFDGVLARFASSFEGITDFSLKASAFVVDQRVEHFAYVGELELLNLWDSGFDLKYSLIHWDREGKNSYQKKHPKGVRFVNSQVTAAYNLSPDLLNMKAKVYGAYLHNHKAPKWHGSNYKRANDAFYVGALLGEIVRKGDWSADFCYQWVQAQAVSERDGTDSCRDNPKAVSFYNKKWGGTSNYQGWRLEGIYALTDNWTINAHFDRIYEQDRKIGGNHRSFEFYLATIFTF